MIRYGQQNQLDIRAKNAIIRMSNTLEDINQKLDHIIKRQEESFFHINNHVRRRWQNGR